MEGHSILNHGLTTKFYDMKRIILLATFLAILFTGCKKENEKPDIVQPEEGEFLAVVTDNVTDMLKDLGLSRECVFWHNDDSISLMRNIEFGLKYVVKSGSSKQTTSLFVEDKDFKYTGINNDNNITVKSSWDDYMNAHIAIYPFQDYDYLKYGGNEIDPKYRKRVHTIRNVLLPPIQKYNKDGFSKGVLPMVAVTDNSDLRILYFKNILGFIKLPLKGSVTVKNITLKGNNEEALSGCIDFICSSEIEPDVTRTRAWRFGRDVTLDEINVKLNNKKSRDFWFAIPPATYSKGLTIEIATEEGFLVTHKVNEPVTVLGSKATALNELIVDDSDKELYIPDIAFKDALFKSGVDMNNDGKITLYDAQMWNKSNIEKKFDLAYAKSLEGIKFFTELRTLKCDNSVTNNMNLSNLDLRDNTKLEHIELIKCGLTELPKGINDNIKTLNVSQNKLSELDVSRFKSLNVLDCSYNIGITILDLDNNTSLYYLNCMACRLTTLDVSKTKIGDNIVEYPLKCYMFSLKGLYLKKDWKIKGINIDRNSEYICSETSISYKD